MDKVVKVMNNSAELMNKPTKVMNTKFESKEKTRASMKALVSTD
ncbi:hypothetical protein [Bacillus kexueae]|nr:hypothetical protein [Bacillus kexueae]